MIGYVPTGKEIFLLTLGCVHKSRSNHMWVRPEWKGGGLLFSMFIIFPCLLVWGFFVKWGSGEDGNKNRINWYYC